MELAKIEREKEILSECYEAAFQILKENVGRPEEEGLEHQLITQIAIAMYNKLD